LRNYRLYLEDILRAIESIEHFVEGMSFEQFVQDDKTSSAVLRKLEVMGEAAKHVPDEIKEGHPDVAWKQMAGMRDKLIHFYFGVDHALVWTTIKERLPEVKQQILQMLGEL